jgi:hypothetical protein
MADEKLQDLNRTLMGVENELQKRKIDRQDATIDGALDVINTAAADGAIDVDDCDGCEDDEAGDSGAQVADGEGEDGEAEAGGEEESGDEE